LETKFQKKLVSNKLYFNEEGLALSYLNRERGDSGCGAGGKGGRCGEAGGTPERVGGGLWIYDEK